VQESDRSPVNYDRSLFDDTVAPYHNWACVSEDDDLWMYDRACAGRI